MKKEPERSLCQDENAWLLLLDLGLNAWDWYKDHFQDV